MCLQAWYAGSAEAREARGPGAALLCEPHTRTFPVLASRDCLRSFGPSGTREGGAEELANTPDLLLMLGTGCAGLTSWPRHPGSLRGHPQPGPSTTRQEISSFSLWTTCREKAWRWLRPDCALPCPALPDPCPTLPAPVPGPSEPRGSAPAWRGFCSPVWGPSRTQAGK